MASDQRSGERAETGGRVREDHALVIEGGVGEGELKQLGEGVSESEVGEVGVGDLAVRDEGEGRVDEGQRAHRVKSRCYYGERAELGGGERKGGEAADSPHCRVKEREIGSQLEKRRGEGRGRGVGGDERRRGGEAS